MLVIPKRLPLNSRHIAGAVVFVAGFVGTSSLLHTYVPRSDLNSDVVLTPESTQKKDASSVPIATPADKEATSDSTQSIYGYKPEPEVLQSSTEAAPAPVVSNPVVTPESPPVVEQPAEQPPQEPATPEQPAPEVPAPGEPTNPTP